MKKLKELLKKLLSLFKKEKPASVEVLPELNEVIVPAPTPILREEKTPDVILPHITAPSTRVYIGTGTAVPMDPVGTSGVDHSLRVLDVPGVWRDLYEGKTCEYAMPGVKAGMRVALQTGNVYNEVHLKVLLGVDVVHSVQIMPGLETQFVAPKDGDYVVRVNIYKGQNKGSINHWRY